MVVYNTAHGRITILVAACSILVACGSSQRQEREVARDVRAPSSAAALPAGDTSQAPEAPLGDFSEPLHDATIQQLREASEMVVVGRVVSTETGVQISDDPDAQHIVYTLAVDEVLKGAPAPTVSVAMMGTAAGIPILSQRGPLPQNGRRGIWFLQSIAPQFKRSGYVLTNQSSLVLANEDGSRLTGGGGDESPVHREITRSNLAQVVALLRSSRNG